MVIKTKSLKLFWKGLKIFIPSFYGKNSFFKGMRDILKTIPLQTPN
ncbi:hypothetical protein OUQ_0714 [Helicobacter pylori R055a]|nr:hypothetical protein OUQ_0714 [Helicobacter pylori R055a]